MIIDWIPAFAGMTADLVLRLLTSNSNNRIHPMVNHREVRQKVENFNKKAVMVLTTALRLPLMLVVGCGYVTKATNSMYLRMPVKIHDHDGKLEVLINDKMSPMMRQSTVK